MSITKVHTVYKLKNGEKVPGTTTILSILEKPALLKWAWQCGIDGLDYLKVRDTAASVGTIAHYLIKCHFKKEKPDLSEFSKANIDKAENAFIAYLDFEKNMGLKPIKVEEGYVSEQYKFGGTIDCYCELGGKKALVDFKTSKGLYPEMRVQVAAYEALLRENGLPVEERHLLRIDKESGEFNHHKLEDLSEEWELFKILVQAYSIKSRVWKK